MISEKFAFSLVLMLITTHLILGRTKFDERLISEENWFQWKRMHHKQYANARDEANRRNRWMKNVARVMQHNIQYDLGLVSYSVGLNAFADLSWDEFRAQYLSGLMNASLYVDNGMSRLAVPFNESVVKNIPDSLDWRQYGLVREVKNQGSCGSCWAFSTTGAIEGQYKLKYNVSQEFSEQQLVDCSRTFGNHGCDGGLMEEAYQYLEHFGLETEDDYPYEEIDDVCHFDQRKAKVMVKSFTTMNTGNEEQLKALVAHRGPVAIAIDGAHGFQFYQQGIYRSNSCSPQQLNHGVLAVGYGSEDGSAYWIVKNSWSANWGEQGYIRMARNHGNMCGVATMASVPDLK